MSAEWSRWKARGGWRLKEDGRESNGPTDRKAWHGRVEAGHRGGGEQGAIERWVQEWMGKRSGFKKMERNDVGGIGGDKGADGGVE